MRTIKFRAWNKVRKCWIWKPRWQVCYNDANTELVQYTGLKDKNNVEVYEGDIITFIWDSRKWIQKVIFSGSGFYPHQFDISLHETNSLISMKVIGNIYENPELLK